MSAAMSNRSFATWWKSGLIWFARKNANRSRQRRIWLRKNGCLTRWWVTNASPATRESFKKKLRDGELDTKEIEIEVSDNSNPMGDMEIPGMPGASVGVLNLNDMFGKAFGGRTKKRKTTVKESYDVLVADESDKLLDNEQIVGEAIEAVENNGIVFLDEIDKIAVSERMAVVFHGKGYSAIFYR